MIKIIVMFLFAAIGNLIAEKVGFGTAGQITFGTICAFSASFLFNDL